MVLSDREAADSYASQAVGQAHAALTRALAAGGGNEALAFRNGLRKAVADLSTRLVEVYSQLESASETATRNELVNVITERVSAFVQSSVAGRRGPNAPSAAREGARVIADLTAGIGRTFDLAIYEQQRKRKATVQPPVATQSDTTRLVLFVSANPDPSTPLKVEQEESRIAKVRNGSKYQSSVRIESLPDLDLIEFAKSLRLHKPVVLHFSGHGAPDGSLHMRDENGTPFDMHPEGLAKLVALQKNTLRLIVLNACYSNELVARLVDHIDCVIGMTDAVSDDAAILFAQSFYSTLFDGHTIAESFDTAAAVVAARYHDEKDTPALSTRAGVDAATISLVG